MKNKAASSSADNQRRTGISRRHFLKLSGLAGAALIAGRFFSGQAQGTADTTSAPPTSTGVLTEDLVVTACLNCAARCGIKVRVVNGRAVKVYGNPLSRVSEGKTCGRADIGLQVLYDPDRVTTPLKRTSLSKGRNIDPGWVPIPWEEAFTEISQRLTALRNSRQSHQLLILQGLIAASDEDLLKRLATAYGTPNLVNFDGLDKEAECAGEWMADGHYTRSAYDLENTNYILSFGASILESSQPLARNLRMWGKIRRERASRARIVVIDPRYSVTALRADRWLPINPGTDAALAMAMANVIIKEGLYDHDFIARWTSGFEDYRELALHDYDPENVAPITGIPAETISQVAREFARTRPAIAWRGRGATSWPGGSYAAYAIFCLNALVGSIDVPGGVIYQEDVPLRPMPDIAADDIATAGLGNPCLDKRMTQRFPASLVVTNQIADAILEDDPYPVMMAMGFNPDFAFSAPGTWRWDEAMKKIPYYVHISPFASEMAQYADLLLPAHTFLEAWGYDYSPPGAGYAELRIRQPVVPPRYDSRDAADIIFEIASRTGGAVARAFADIGGGAAGFARYRAEKLISWEKFRNEGVWQGPAYEYHKYDTIFKTPTRKFEFYSGNLESLLREQGRTVAKLTCLPHYEPGEFLGDEGEYPLLLSSYRPLLVMESGSQNCPWAQELFLVMHGAGWTSFAEINSRTASTLGIKDGDMVWVESPFGRIQTRARVIEGIHPGVVSIAMGQGHHAGGRWASGIGVNPNCITGVAYDALSGQAAFYNTRVKVYRA